VPGCGVVLDSAAGVTSMYARNRTCEAHGRALAVDFGGGVLMRFCQARRALRSLTHARRCGADFRAAAVCCMLLRLRAQKCHRMQPTAEFSGERRTCHRVRAAHNARQRAANAARTQARADGGGAGASAGASAGAAGAAAPAAALAPSALFFDPLPAAPALMEQLHDVVQPYMTGDLAAWLPLMYALTAAAPPTTGAVAAAAPALQPPAGAQQGGENDDVAPPPPPPAE
jgi:hypothetical protein